MALQVDVWSDFVCPWCFLASSSLEKLEATYHVEVIWHAYELRPKGSPPMPEAYRARIEESRPQLEAIAREHYGLELKHGPFGIDSRPALIGMVYAEEQGAGHAYHKAVFRAYWQQGLSIDNLDVLREIAESVNLDGEAFLQALHNPVYEQAVIDDIGQAQAYGLSGVPAMVFQGKYLVSGAQPYETLKGVVEKIEAQEMGA